MKKLLIALLLFNSQAFAGGSSPGLYYGLVPTASQWNSYFAAKLDYTPGLVNQMGYWDGSGNFLNAAVSGDCTSVANSFTCAGREAVALSAVSASIGGSALIAGACATTSTTVTGATVGMAVYSTPTTFPGAGNLWHSYISAANTVVTEICAIIAATPVASTYQIRVFP